LLYKDLSEAVRIVKGEGAKAGFVTSGFGLDTGYITELIAAGIDFIGFSLAGVTPGPTIRYESILILTHLLRLLKAALK